ncbi:unnamed protein product [Litomosoides sigmodontis]|uniref:Uncharacterized protein n=1 Tax=Litomosoides sigmodontis TaxID=42156 RepID=A0A3P6T8U6_LITSI|nr:unnamed protein product [Litomosoides sigmodontis]
MSTKMRFSFPCAAALLYCSCSNPKSAKVFQRTGNPLDLHNCDGDETCLCKNLIIYEICRTDEANEWKSEQKLNCDEDDRAEQEDYEEEDDGYRLTTEHLHHVRSIFE